jgi:hypothetical protein
LSLSYIARKIVHCKSNSTIRLRVRFFSKSRRRKKQNKQGLTKRWSLNMTKKRKKKEKMSLTGMKKRSNYSE